MKSYLPLIVWLCLRRFRADLWIKQRNTWIKDEVYAKVKSLNAYTTLIENLSTIASQPALQYNRSPMLLWGWYFDSNLYLSQNEVEEKLSPSDKAFASLYEKLLADETEYEISGLLYGENLLKIIKAILIYLKGYYKSEKLKVREDLVDDLLKKVCNESEFSNFINFFGEVRTYKLQL